MSEKKPGKPKSGLSHRLSIPGTKFLQFFRARQKNSGYAIYDQLPTPPDEADGDFLPSPNFLTNSQRSHDSLQRLESQEEAEEETDLAETSDEASITQGAASQQTQHHWNNKKRHQITIQFSLLLEQDRTCHALYLADVMEAGEILRLQLQQVQDEEENVSEQQLGVRRRKREKSLSSNCSGSSYFENRRVDKQGMRRKSDWYKDWQKRTSNGMYEDYRNDLDYRY